MTTADQLKPNMNKAQAAVMGSLQAGSTSANQIRHATQMTIEAVYGALAWLEGHGHAVLTISHGDHRKDSRTWAAR